MQEQHKAVDEPLFAARLTPHRSLGRKGYLILMGFITLICLGAGVIFWAVGAWPVFGFLGLDVVLIWLAFKLNYRSGRTVEEISIWRDELRIQKTHPSGKIKTHTFNPFWTRFCINRHEEYGIMRMFLISKKRELDIGSFLNPSDRDSFAKAFGSALSKAKSG